MLHAIQASEYKRTNTTSVKITIHGQGTRTVSNREKQRNALLMGIVLQGMLPVFENSMYTEGCEGFYHLEYMEGDMEKARMLYSICDHNAVKFNQKKTFIENVVAYLNTKYGKNAFVLDYVL